MEINNNFPDKKVGNLVNSFQLSYKDNNEVSNSVRKATNIGSTKNQQYVQSIALKNTPTTQGKSTL